MIVFNGNKEAEKLDVLIDSRSKILVRDKQLAIVRVGDDPASKKYVELKRKLCSKYNIPVSVYEFSLDLSDEKIISDIRDVLFDDEVGGVIIQLPILRKSLKNIVNLIPSTKDIDALTNTTLTQYMQKKNRIWPPMARALKHYLEVNNIDVKSKDIKMVGGGDLVGRSLMNYLLNEGASITVFENIKESKTRFKEVKKVTYKPQYKTGDKICADLIILGTDKPNVMRGKDICKDTHIVDFGSTLVDGKTTGNLDKNSEIAHLGAVSLSPGGMGPLVVRYLILNYLDIINPC